MGVRKSRWAEVVQPPSPIQESRAVGVESLERAVRVIERAVSLREFDAVSLRCWACISGEWIRVLVIVVEADTALDRRERTRPCRAGKKEA